MHEKSPRQNIFFPLTVLFGTVFIITTLAFMASMLGEPSAPVTVFLFNNAGWMLSLEAGGTIGFGLLALAVDRRQILQETETVAASAAASEDSTRGEER